MNKVSLIGRLTKTPELKQTNNQNSFSTFTIAVNRNYKNKDGKIEADFINCVVYGKIAETFVEYCDKGRLIAVNGSINTSTYESENGAKKYTTIVRVDNIEFLESKKTTKEKNIENMSNSEIIQEVMTNDDPFKEFSEETDGLELPF